MKSLVPNNNWPKRSLAELDQVIEEIIDRNPDEVQQLEKLVEKLMQSTREK
jgi:hypothetical protein